MKICIIMKSPKKNDDPLLDQLRNVISPFSDSIYLISPNFSGFLKIRDELRLKNGGNRGNVANYVPHGFKNLCVQLFITFEVLMNTDIYDLVLFYTGARSLFLPALASRLLGKKIVCIYTGSSYKQTLAKNQRFYASIGWCFEKVMLNLSDIIVVYAESCVKDFGLCPYINKIDIGHEHFVDLHRFMIEKSIGERENMVGFIGRLSGEKGILNFVTAIPKVLKTRGDVRFLIGGEGYLRGKIEESLKKWKLTDKVETMGWIPHDNLPKYLNDLKLLVIPSHTEAGPLIAFEAMACGTPVLGSRVGMMQDIIVSGKNGFLLENNSAECIAKNILEILDRKDLHEISENGRRTVEKNFTYEIAVKRYKEILESI